jgi:hypothetical protein
MSIIIKQILAFLWKYKTIVLIVLLSGGLFWSINLNKSKDVEIGRLSNNQETLFDSINTFKTKDGKSAATIKRLELTQDEFKAHEQQYKKTIADLGIKLKYVQSLVSTGTTTTIDATGKVKDSIVYKDKQIDTLKCFTYKTPWIEQNGCLSTKTKTFEGHTIVKDTVDFVIYRIPKRFLFFKCGTKALEIKATVKNPDAKIVSGKYIDFNSIPKK